MSIARVASFYGLAANCIARLEDIQNEASNFDIVGLPGNLQKAGILYIERGHIYNRLLISAGWKTGSGPYRSGGCSILWQKK